MTSFNKTVANWRAFFQSFALRGKIASLLLGAMLILGAAVTLPTYLLARQKLGEHALALLDVNARFASQAIALKLNGLLTAAELLAGNQLTSKGEAVPALSSAQSGIALPQKLAVDGVVLRVFNRAGQAVASSADAGSDFAAAGLLTAMFSTGQVQSQVFSPGGASASLWIAKPVHPPQNNQIVGGVLLEVPLAAMLATQNNSYQQWLSDNDAPLFGVRPASEVFEVANPISFGPGLENLKLRLHLAQLQDDALSELNTLLAIFAFFGILIVLGMLVLARFGARYITIPLDKVVLAAEEIAASGLLVKRLPIKRSDEFGRLSAAFNTMLDHLAKSWADLEQCIAERTREHEERQQDSERANSLLREAVNSFTQGFTIYDENDRLVLCNEAYLNFYAASRDLIVPGASFEEIIRQGAARGQYSAANTDIEAWVKQQVSQHQNAHGEIIEQQLGDGRWLLVVEYRTPSGCIVGNRLDITELKRTSEALRQRELYLRATLDNLPFLFWLKDPDSRFLAVNKRFSDACGQPSPEAIIGLTDFDIWPPALAEQYRQDDFAVMASRREKALEEPLAGASDPGWIETYKKPVIADDGRVLGTVGFARDISERKIMQEALLDSEQRWALAVNGANDGIWDWNPKTGKVFFSDRWKSMLGYAPDEISDSFDDWDERIHPDDREATYAALQRHLGGEVAYYECEHRLRCKDGSYKWILDRGQAQFDPDGKPLRMAGSHTDITKRREAEARIHDRNEQLNAIFDLSPDGFVSFDAEHRVKYANPAFFRMTGMTETEILDLDETDFDVRLARLCIERAKFPGLATLRGLSPVGDERQSRRQLIELTGPGKRVLEIGLRQACTETVSQILYFRDVTHETEVDRIKTEFLSTAAHELRTPMASIYGFTELLLNEAFDEADRREFLDTIYRQSGLMIAILNELLDLSRIEARRGKDFKIELINLPQLLNQITAGFMPPADREKPLQLADDGSVGEDIWIRGDRNKLTQAIGNVLSNAYKYSPAGGPVEIEVSRVSATEGLPARLAIRITDHGIGLAPHQLIRICERFYRADSSGKIPGTGLGMSIVKEIIELHSGELQFVSALGAGTTVTLWLPAAIESEGK